MENVQLPKILLIVYTREDFDELGDFSKLEALRGWNIKAVREDKIATSSDVAMYAHKINARAVICSSAYVLKMVLEVQFDYNQPNTSKAITLDDYAGSVLSLHPIGSGIPGREFLVVNPLAHLRTTRSGKFLFNRYVGKVTRPEEWYPQTEFKWEVVDCGQRPERAAEILQLAERADLIGDDIETAIGDSERRITVVGFCLYFKATHTTLSVVIPFNSVENWLLARAIAQLPIRKVFQNGLYDNLYKARWNCLPSHWFWDTQSLFHCWYSELPKRLDFVTSFSIRRIRFWKDDGSTGNVEDYYRYNGLDTWATVNACLSLVHEMPDWAVNNYLQEFPLHFPALTCNLEGLRMDMPLLKKVQVEKEADSTTQLASLKYITNSPDFNPGSWQQVLKLFTILGLKGFTSTGKVAMLKAKATSVFNDIVLTKVTDYKENRKLLDTYFVEGKFWNDRLYYSLNPAATDTGRFASTASSFWCGLQIQNIPRGDSVKQCIMADDGWLLAEIDKAQSEARCVGYLAGEEKLIAVVEGENDYHSWNASAFFGVAYAAIYDNAKGKTLDKALRDLSKRTNHGANYNMGADVMLDTMGPKNVIRAKVLLRLPASFSLRKVTQYLLDRYATTYPKVKDGYYKHIIKRIVLEKRLVSAFGWTRYFFGKPDQNKQDLNAAVAHEPQNLSVAIINREFYAIWHATVYGELRGLVRLKAQIHDSIMFQYRYPFRPEYIRETYMNTRVKITDPLGVTREMFIPSDVSAGKVRWSELK